MALSSNGENPNVQAANQGDASIPTISHLGQLHSGTESSSSPGNWFLSIAWLYLVDISQPHPAQASFQLETRHSLCHMPVLEAEIEAPGPLPLIAARSTKHPTPTGPPVGPPLAGWWTNVDSLGWAHLDPMNYSPVTKGSPWSPCPCLASG